MNSVEGNQDWDEAQKYMEAITAASGRHAVPVEVILGIGSRESAWGRTLTPHGPAGVGDHGHGRGLMQIDDRWHKEFISSGKWSDPAKNIDYGVALVKANVDSLIKKYPGETDLALQRALAAYNCGLGNLFESIAYGEDVDSRTTGQNYSADVLARAQFFAAKLAVADVSV